MTDARWSLTGGLSCTAAVLYSARTYDSDESMQLQCEDSTYLGRLSLRGVQVT